MAKDTSKQVYPVLHQAGAAWYSDGGLTIREYAAVRCLAAMIAADTGKIEPEDSVGAAVHYADLLVKELGK